LTVLDRKGAILPTTAQLEAFLPVARTTDASVENNEWLFVMWTGAASMKDYQAQIEKLRKDAAECARIRDLATDDAKREMFDRIASHLTVLADQIEMAMIERGKRHA